jgi:fibronectin type 3 domain-containing protein
MAYDSGEDRIILFGGSSTGYGLVADTWSFDYSKDTWSDLAPTTAPVPREISNMVYDIAANRTILFGGLEMSGPSGDTWSYDYGTNAWSILAVNSPGDLFIPSMAYDSTQDRVLLFGGTELVGSMYVWKNDTWALSLANKTWTNTHPSTSPPPRGGASATYNSFSEVGLVFGGTNTFANTSSGYFNDTWAYNATANAWSDVTPVESPSPRILSVLAYDPIADRTVLFGGAPGSGIPYDDAWGFQYIPAGPSLPPSAPRNLQATGGDSQIALAWAAPSLNGSARVEHYRIYRGTVPGAESLLATVGQVLTYNDSAVANGVTYYYEVSAASSAGEGPKSNETSAMPRGVPSAPLGLTGVTGNAQVTLSWQAPTSDGGSTITNYTVYRGTSAGGETFLISLGASFTYVDLGLANGQTYYYEVTATNAVGEGAKSAETAATPADVPSEPRALMATAVSGHVALSWTDPASNGGSAITGYNVYRGTSAGTETLLTTVGPVLAYTDGDVTPGTTYYYEVSAVNPVGVGPKSNEASATPATAPAMPRSLAAAAGPNEVTLSWVAPISDGGSSITGYKVYRATSVGAETLLATGGVVLSYTDSDLTNGQAYYYEVSAANAVGEGPKSNEASATPTAPPDTMPPTITISSPANNTETSSTTVTISGTAGDNVAAAKVEVSTDGATWTTASGTTAWSANVTLRVGSNTIYARATDASGNQATTRITVVVTPPTTGVSGLPLPFVEGFGIVVVVLIAATAFLVSRRRRS